MLYPEFDAVQGWLMVYVWDGPFGAVGRGLRLGLDLDCDFDLCVGAIFCGDIAWLRFFKFHLSQLFSSENAGQSTDHIL
jgi:hypothetical protein